MQPEERRPQDNRYHEQADQHHERERVDVQHIEYGDGYDQRRRIRPFRFRNTIVFHLRLELWWRLLAKIVLKKRSDCLSPSS